MALTEAAAPTAAYEDPEIEPTRRWMDGARFAETARLYSPRQVVEQRGVIETDYPVARIAADRLHARLRELFAERRSITTFGPVLPRPCGGDEAGRDRGPLPWRMGHLGQGLGHRGPRTRTWRATPSRRFPTRPPALSGPCSPPIATSASPAHA